MSVVEPAKEPTPDLLTRLRAVEGCGRLDPYAVTDIGHRLAAFHAADCAACLTRLVEAVHRDPSTVDRIGPIVMEMEAGGAEGFNFTAEWLAHRWAALRPRVLAALGPGANEGGA